MDQLPIVDGHLDLAENVTLFGRDLTTSVEAIRKREGRTRRQATVSLDELERGSVAVICATVTPGFLAADVGAHFEPRSALYETAEQAEAHALAQIDLYEGWEREGRIRLLKSVTDLEQHLRLWKADRKPGLVLLMEGADPIVHVRDLPRWWKRGLRMIGLTYGDTRYSTGVGTGTPTPPESPARARTSGQSGLTSEGFALLEQMAELGFIWDISHLSEEGVWQGFGLGFPHVCASHANARALIPTDRHLSDAAIRALAARDGMIGLVLYNGYLESRWKENRSIPVTLDQHLRRHADHIAQLVGWKHIGIGSDLDGGIGLEESPLEIETVADLYKVGSALPDTAREAVLSTNWLDFLRASLPLNA